MAVHMDLIIPPVIIGLLIIMIFNVKSLMIESSVNNRLNNDMQTFAEVTATVLQEEIKLIQNFLDVKSDSIRYISTNRDTVLITRKGRDIHIARYVMATSIRDTLIIPASLSNLQFIREPHDVAIPAFLRVRVETESLPEHHVQLKNGDLTVSGFAERRVLLRNIAVQANQ